MTLARKITALTLAVAIYAAATAAQLRGQSSPRVVSPDWVGALSDDYLRLMQLTGAVPPTSLLIRPLTRRPLGANATFDPARGSTPANPWGGLRTDSGSGSAWAMYAPAIRSTLNSAIPFGFNDGALWAGRGLAGAATAGVGARGKGFSVRLAPTVSWSQNRPFALAPLVNAPANASPFADQWRSRSIDRPQRFGNGTYATADFGESVLRYDWRALTLGAGTESMWWGPGVQNALLMTNNAAGIPHAFVGTGSPVDVWIGTLEAMYVAGRLYDSDYWRVGTQANRNRRWMSAIVASFSPRGAPGLYVGGGRVFYEYIPEGGLGFGDLFDVLEPFQKKKLVSTSAPNGDDAADQMLSLFARWVFPESGFEVYGEWGRNDHSSDTRDFILEPDHAAATLLGFQKVFRQSGGFLRIGAEATSLALGRTAELRPAPTWYSHHIVVQGFTQRGQVVGAGIGPGSDMQSATLDWFRRWGSVGVEVQRWRNDSDAFYEANADPARTASNHRKHDVWLGGGLHGTVAVGPVAVALRAVRGTERNRYAVLENDVSSWHLELRAELAR